MSIKMQGTFCKVTLTHYFSEIIFYLLLVNLILTIPLFATEEVLLNTKRKQNRKKERREKRKNEKYSTATLPQLHTIKSTRCQPHSREILVTR